MQALTKFVSMPLLLALLIAMPAAFAQEDEPAFSQAELDQMLAPIALYPDALLSQILIAATYPLEVVEVARWSRANPGLEGEQAVEAIADRDWEPSGKALVALPQVLARMDTDLTWTRPAMVRVPVHPPIDAPISFVPAPIVPKHAAIAGRAIPVGPGCAAGRPLPAVPT